MLRRPIIPLHRGRYRFTDSAAVNGLSSAHFSMRLTANEPNSSTLTDGGGSLATIRFVRIRSLICGQSGSPEMAIASSVRLQPRSNHYTAFPGVRDWRGLSTPSFSPITDAAALDAGYSRPARRRTRPLPVCPCLQPIDASSSGLAVNSWGSCLSGPLVTPRRNRRRSAASDGPVGMPSTG